MYRPFIVAGAIFGGLGVVLGAFASHGLQNLTSDDQIIHGFQTGVQYQVFHGLALLATAIIYERFPNNFMKWAGYGFIAGIILFSGSLYTLTLLKIEGSGLTRYIGPVTPLGGIAFMAGWLLLMIGALKKKL